MSVSRGKREPYFNCNRVTGSEQKAEPPAYTDRVSSQAGGRQGVQNV